MNRGGIVIPYLCKIKFKPYEKRPYPQVDVKKRTIHIKFDGNVFLQVDVVANLFFTIFE